MCVCVCVCVILSIERSPGARRLRLCRRRRRTSDIRYIYGELKSKIYTFLVTGR